MNKKLMVLSGAVAAFALPALVFAQATLGSVVGTAGGLINMVMPILISIAVIVFIWGVISYVISADEESRTKARDKIIYGLIGLVAIVGMWGLVSIITHTFGIGTGGSSGVAAPCIPGTSGC